MSTAQSTNNTRTSAAVSSNNAVSAGGTSSSSGVTHGGGRGGKASLLVAGNIVQKISRDIRCVTGASSSMASEIQSRTRQLLRQQHERMQQEREEMKEEVHARASHNKKLKKSNENGEASLTPHAGEESDENVSGENKKQSSSQQQPSSIPVVSTIQANAITNRELAQQLDEFKRQKRILQLRLKEQNAARQALLDVAEQHQHQNPTDINSAQRKIQDAAEALVLDTTQQQQGDETNNTNITNNNNNNTGVTPTGPFSPKSVTETPQNGKNNNRSTPTSRPVSPSTTTTTKNDIVKPTTTTTSKSLFDQTNFGKNNTNKTSTSESLQNKDQQTGRVQTGLEDHEDSLTRNKQRTHSTKNSNNSIDTTNNNNNNTIQVLDEDPDAPYAVGPVLCKPVGGKYIPVRRLGAGSFGEVYIVYWQPSDQAVNAIRQRQMQDRERLQRELEKKREEIIALQRRDETDPTHQDNGPDQQQQQQQQQLSSPPSSIPSANYSKAKYRDGTTLGTSENGKNTNINTIIGGGNNSALNNNQILQDSDDNLDNQPLLDVPVSPYATSPAGLVSGLASTALTVSVSVPGAAHNSSNASNNDEQQQLHFPRENIFVCKVEPDNALKERQQEVKDGLRTDKTETEEYVLANCAHPNIVGFVDEFSHDERKYLVMEYVDGGDLKQEINRRANGEIIRYIAEESVLFLAVQVLLAMEYLHRHNILHRDLKSANILLSKKWMVKLGDFGFAKHYTYDVDGAVDTSTLGTPYYIAPEVYKRKPYGEKAEMFAFGVILYELVALHRPFREDDLTTIVRSILFDHPKPIRRSNISLELLRVIDSLLQKDPTKRPSAKECLRMEVFQKPLQHYLRRVKKVANDPAVGTELDKVWFRVLAEHIDTIYDDNMSSSKSRFRMSRSRSRDKEAISTSSRASSRTSAYSTDRSSRSSSEGGGSNNNKNSTSRPSRRIIGGGSTNKRKSSQDRRGGGGSTNVATSRNQ